MAMPDWPEANALRVELAEICRKPHAKKLLLILAEQARQLNEYKGNRPRLSWNRSHGD